MILRERIINCIEHLESLRKQAMTEHSHYYVDAAAKDAIDLLYEFLSTVKEG